MESKIFSHKNKIISLFNQGCSQSIVSKYIKKNVGLGRTQCNFWAKKLNPNKSSDDIEQSDIDSKLKKLWSFVESGDNATIEKITSERVKTLEDLVRVCEIDLNVWRVEKYEVNSYENHTKLRRYGEDGNRIDDNHKVVQLFQVKCYLARNKENILKENILENFKENVKLFAPRKFLKREINIGADNLYFLGIVDQHIGSLVWGKEINLGGDYDSKIAIERYRKAVDYLINRVENNSIEKIVLPVGNDFYNSDNIQPSTAAGTPMTEDSRWMKSFMAGASLLTDVIGELSTKFIIEVPIILGNHATTREFYLGEYLKAFFRNNKDVLINNSPVQRKYFRYGVNLIGLVHGHKEKHQNLPILMAQETGKDWSDSKYKFWFLGHYHHQVVKEYNGVKVEILPTLASPCHWSSGIGFSGNSLASKGFLFNEVDGLIAEYYFNL